MQFRKNELFGKCHKFRRAPMKNDCICMSFAWQHSFPFPPDVNCARTFSADELIMNADFSQSGIEFENTIQFLVL